jgi:hypothetical protein
MAAVFFVPSRPEQLGHGGLVEGKRKRKEEEGGEWQRRAKEGGRRGKGSLPYDFQNLLPSEDSPKCHFPMAAVLYPLNLNSSAMVGWSRGGKRRREKEGKGRGRGKEYHMTVETSSCRSVLPPGVSQMPLPDGGRLVPSRPE